MLLLLLACGPARGQAAPPSRVGERVVTEVRGRQADSPAPSPSPNFGVPTGGRLQVDESGFGLGSRTPDPTALNGANRQEVVLFDSTRIATIAITGGYLHKIGDNGQLLLELEGDPSAAIGDLSYSYSAPEWSGTLTFQAVGSTAANPAFDGGRNEVGLPGGGTPYVRRLGGGVEWGQKVSDELSLAAALNYQQISVGDAVIGGQLTPRDALGSPLTIDPSGRDEQLELRLVGLYFDQNDLNYPTDGSKLRFEAAQGFTLGHGSFTRLDANFAQLFQVVGGDTPHSVLLNLQAGTVLGQLAPYDAFNLGGANSVRGYETGELGTARSFFQATLEYRAGLARFQLFGNDIGLRAVLFADYGTGLGSEGQVPGRPALERGKDLHGFGYGGGLHFMTPAGLFRFETGWNGHGQNAFYITVGERF